jgi:periplasmic mercuric ion binding protein
MKIVKSFAVLALTAVLFISCNDKSKDGNVDTDATTTDTTVVDTTMAKETAANLETATFKIDGMTCPMGCAATIEKKLAKMEGVGEAKVDYEKKTATVSYDPAKQTPEKFVETVEGLADGAYKVSDVKNSADKAYYNGDHDKDKKKKKAEAKAKKSTAKAGDKPMKAEDKKASCHSGEKKGGCCMGEAKKSCHSEEKGGSM